MFAQLAIAIVLAYISYLLAPKPEAPQPHSLKDFDVPSVDPAKEIVVIFGTGWLKDPNVTWYGDLGTKSIKTKGGKK